MNLYICSCVRDGAVLFLPVTGITVRNIINGYSNGKYSLAPLLAGPAMKREKEQDNTNEYDRSELLLHMARI